MDKVYGIFTVVGDILLRQFGIFASDDLADKAIPEDYRGEVYVDELKFTAE